MSRYLQTSTENPYGHRPWATRLYTGFENFAFAKQPQNAIIREDVNMRPEIYRPPEMKPGLGEVTIVGGSGRILRRARRRTLGAVTVPTFWQRIFPSSVSPIVRPISTGPVLPGPMPVWYPAPPRPMPISITILPPPLVPPVPQPIASGPGGTIVALPGSAPAPGSPFAPSQLLPGAVPISAAAADAASTPTASSLSDWFNAQTWIAGIPNGYVAIGVGGVVLYMISKGKK